MVRPCRKLAIRIRCVGLGHTWAPYLADENSLLMFMKDLKREDGDQIILLKVNSMTFFLKIFEDISSFCGATDTPVLDFGWRLAWVSKPGWSPHLRAFLPTCNGFPRFTSGVTPAAFSTHIPRSTDMSRSISGAWIHDLAWLYLEIHKYHWIT